MNINVKLYTFTPVFDTSVIMFQSPFLCLTFCILFSSVCFFPLFLIVAIFPASSHFTSHKIPLDFLRSLTFLHFHHCFILLSCTCHLPPLFLLTLSVGSYVLVLLLFSSPHRRTTRLSLFPPRISRLRL